MFSDKEYKNLLEFSKKKLIQNHVSSLSEFDVSNEAYLRLKEDGLEINTITLSRMVVQIIRKSKDVYSESSRKEIESTRFRFCKKCKEDKPIGAFGVTQIYTGKKIFQTYCAECQAKIMREYRKFGQHKKYDYKAGALKRYAKKIAESYTEPGRQGDRINKIAFGSLQDFKNTIAKFNNGVLLFEKKQAEYDRYKKPGYSFSKPFN